MKIPVITGIVRRRILLNYRVDPGVMRRQVPGNFRLKLVRGYAIAGVCMIRLEQIRPKGMPALVGVSSENAAHRISVEWETPDGVHEGVYIPRRDTGSALNSMIGGRLFPGVHRLSEFKITDQPGRLRVLVTSPDLDRPLVEAELREPTDFPASSVFASLQESSDFFLAGCIGYSVCPNSSRLDGVALKTFDWRVTPWAMEMLKSSYYDDRAIFPESSIAFDHALVMRDIPHEWHAEPELHAEETCSVPT